MDTVVVGKSDKHGFLIMRVVSLLVCFTLVSVKAVAAAVINPFPDAELVESTTDDQAGSVQDFPDGDSRIRGRCGRGCALCCHGD